MDFRRHPAEARPQWFPIDAQTLVRHRDLVRLLAVLIAAGLDVAAIATAAVIAAALRYEDIGLGNTVDLIGAIVPTYFLAGLSIGAYHIDALARISVSLLRAFAALIMAAVIVMVVAFAFKVIANYSRLETGLMLLGALFLLAFSRAIVAVMLRKAVDAAIEPHIVILGDQALQDAGWNESDSTTAIDVRTRDWRPRHDEPMFLQQIYSIVRDADRVLLIFEREQDAAAWAEIMRLTGINAEMIEPRLKEVTPLGIGAWNGVPTVIISRGPLTLSERAIKRVFDLGVIVLLSPLLVPLVATLAVLIKIDSPGPVFFRQDRVARNNRHYRCYKLRTMRIESLDSRGDQSTSRDDNRITRIGRFLRRTSLDEVPQLLNVWTGDMSLVGPRPHALGSRAEGMLFWEAVPGYWTRHAMKPGITGLAQIRGYRGATHAKQDIELRVASDFEYINTWSIWLDIKILAKTIWVIVHQDAY